MIGRWFTQPGRWVWSGWMALALAGTASGAEPVFISEFLAANNGALRDEDGDSSDWIEIYNSGATAVNLGGWYLTDNPLDLTKWAFPATNLLQNDFLVVFASSKNRQVAGAPLHTSFGLSSAGEYLALVHPDGVTIASEFAPAFPEQFDNVSYGIGQNLTTTRYVLSNAAVRVFIPTNATLGTNWIATNFNDSAWLAGTNGVGYESTVPGFAVKNFKANINVNTRANAESVIATPGLQTAVYAENRGVVNYFNNGGAGNYGNDFTVPGFTIGVDVDDYVIEATATITIPAPGNYTFGVNSDDGFWLTVGSFTGGCDCLRGASDTLLTFNFPAAGDFPLRMVFWERGGGSAVEMFAASNSFTSFNPVNFHLVGDTASGGLAVKSTPVSGASSFSFSSVIRTVVQTQMFNRASSAYVRIPFNVASTNTNTLSLTLQVKYDDGFIAYLNGTEVARRNSPAGVPQYNWLATASRTNAAPLTAENINISAFMSLLRTGTNVLAIQGLNDATNGTDFLIAAEMVETRATQTTNFYFSTPTPGTFNQSGTIAFVGDTKFNPGRGFYDTNFSLSITSATAGATIYYTTNGSVPAPGNGYVYAAPIPVNGTLTVRAAAYKSGFQPTDVDTHTYIFVNDVIYQSTNGAAPTAEWPAAQPLSGAQIIDYGMDPDVVNNPTWNSTIRDDLKSLPTFSIVTSISNLFDPANGIYVNPNGAGLAWERPASLELIYPDGTKGFHANFGLRIRGGFSRSGDNPKHAFRVLFRDEYGLGKLQFPLFAKQNGASEFDGFDIRTFQNYSWSFGGDPNGIFMRDVLARDMQLLTGNQGERGDYYHLYVNGQYWGLYNSAERPEASFAATYFGGDNADYDVIKVDPQSGYTILATDGNTDAWFRLWQAATNGFATTADYQKVQGNNPDGSRNVAYENLIDAQNVIDYMLLIFYGGNLDAPISAFLGNTSPNNWYGSRSRLGTGGFRFFAHDSEHTLLNAGEDRTGPFTAGDPLSDGGFPKSNPQYLFQQLAAHADFRQLIGDRAQKHFFNGGTFTVPAAKAQFLARSNEIFRAVVCESARWGDSKVTPPLTRSNWLNAVANVWNNFIPQRSDVIIAQLRAKGWFPYVAAPTFSTNGGIVPLGYALTLSTTNAPGTIYYTLDGSDPRLAGGAINPTAIAYSTPITIGTFRQVRARVKNTTEWSALVDFSFYPLQDYSGLLTTEIMYNPPTNGIISGDEYEFLELKNAGSTTLDLSGAHFTAGIAFTFTNGTLLAPGQFFVLGRNAAQLLSKYPGLVIMGIYIGKLNDGGERITLTHALGAEIFSLTYNDHAPWPVAPDGGGFSLVPRNPNANPDQSASANWRASSAVGGSPGADDPAVSIAPVVINEILSHTVLPTVDKIELFNPTATNVNVGGWFLTDDSNLPKKFRIPNGAIIPAGGYLFFTEADFNPTPGTNNSFSLDSFGEEVYLLSGDAATNLTGYSHGFAFGGAAQDVSFGRYVNSVGDELFPAQIANTLAAANSGPRVGPVVINEIQYHPSLGGDEFVELFNITGMNVALFDPLVPTNTWKLNGLGFTFPTNITLPPYSFALLVATNPAVFRAKYSVPGAVQIFGPYAGTLQDNGENLELTRPGTPTTNGVPYIAVDAVRYNDRLPWPVSANGAGPSLQRLVPSAFGDDPTNWFASGVSVGRTNFFNLSPTVALTAPANGASYVVPANITLTATATDTDGVVTRVEFYANGVKVGETNQPPYTAVWTNPPAGNYALTARAYDNDFGVGLSAPINAFVLTPAPTTLIPTGSVWRYFDKGIDLGTTWITTNSDLTWSNGPAQLGYGDGDEATTNSYGPNASLKYPTTYYRRAITVTNASAFTSLSLAVRRDDGIVVYLNGTEIFRDNMPAGPIAYTNYALVAVADDGNAVLTTNVNPALLVEGTNVIAAEIHQASGTSSDISFELSLTGTKIVVPPFITLQPTNRTVAPGSNTTFVAASGGSAPLAYQWLFNGTNLPGATNATLTRSSVTTNFAGSYFLIVTNTAGSATSQVAVLTVTFPDTDGDGLPDYWELLYGLNPNSAADANLDKDGDGMTNLQEFRAGTNPTNAASVLKLQVNSLSPPRWQFVAQSNLTYSVQFQTNVSSTPWFLLSNVAAQSQVRTVLVADPSPATNRARFYRAVTP